MNIHDTVEAQRAFFRTGATLPVAFRVAALKKLRDTIRAREDAIAAALRQDLGKSDYESYMCETGLALSELRHMIRHTPRYARQQRVHTPLAQFAARSYRQPTPYGNTLILSPWNYPFLLTIDPLADAIAAGNTAIVKPSAYSPATSQLVKELIADCFPPEYVAVVTGGRAENTALLTINKSVCPAAAVRCGGRLTYTFVIRNTGNKAVTAEDLAAVTDVFDPVLIELAVTFNAEDWVSPVNYTYNSVTGLFTTVAGRITVPAATFVQEASGAWTVQPGESVLTVSGTV